MDENKIKILVCCHKESELPQGDIFLPIQVGAALTDKHWGIQRDDECNGQPCDNISSKNKNYCELTAMYWAWKNIKKIYPDLEYIGLNHYRRYFDFEKKKSPIDLFYKNSKECKKYHLDLQSLSKSIQHESIIIPKKKKYPYCLEVDYSSCHISEDFRVLKKNISELHPDYNYDMINIFLHNNLLSHYNMFIMKWTDFDNYCTWLFSILFVVESKTNISNYTDTQKRIYGYMSERMFNLWLFHNKQKIKEVPVIMYCDTKHESSLNRFISQQRNMNSFLISQPIKRRIKILMIKNNFFPKKLYNHHKEKEDKRLMLEKGNAND